MIEELSKIERWLIFPIILVSTIGVWSALLVMEALIRLPEILQTAWHNRNRKPLTTSGVIKKNE